MKNKILNVVCILFALMMVNSGLNKFFNYMPMPELSEEMMQVFGALMTIQWLLPLVALVEIIGGVLFAIPKYRALGAIVILPVMVGIVIHHLVHDVAGVGVGLIMFLINLWALWENRGKYAPIVS
ncbi:DoxX family membrane protein [Sinomicrobium sp. M5D2P9]